MPLKNFINKVFVGDALDIMKQIPKESIDLILTDPPYNISRDIVIQRKGGKFGKAKDIVLDFGEWDKNKITPYDWIPLAYNLLTSVGVLIFFYDKMEISCLAKWLEKEFNMKVRHIGVWLKSNPVPQARKTQWMSGTEFFIIATKNHGAGHHYNYSLGQHLDYIITPICMGRERYRNPTHPTQKPEKLIEPFIKWWSFEGDVVLDPFAGTGTIPYVAYKLGRKFIAIEKDPYWANVIKERIATLKYQAKLHEYY